MSGFKEFPKIARWFRDITITEKIDGTNAQILIIDPSQPLDDGGMPVLDPLADVDGMLIYAGSRNRLLTRQTDNFGFAKWVQENAPVLSLLGPGRHFGEWWGSGIQRGYDLEKGAKRFSLFAVHRWTVSPNDPDEKKGLIPPVPGLDVAPILYEGPFTPPNKTDPVREALRQLQYNGSHAAPGFMNPEGVIIWHSTMRQYAKATLDGDAAKGI